MNLGTISISNQAKETVIDIEGVIGIPENWQFDNPEDRVATYDKFKKSLADIKAISAPKVVINIRSLGGNVNDALLIHDSLCAMNAEIVTRCFGYTASAATLIAQAASKGSRQISRNALYLIHQASSCFYGNIKELQEVGQSLEKVDALIANLYATRSGLPQDKFTELMGTNHGQGTWLSAEETIAAGLADALIESSQIVNISTSTLCALRLPEVPRNKIITNKDLMKIKNTWNAILTFFGFDKEKENELTDNQVGMLNNELESLQGQVSDLKSHNLTIQSDLKEKDATLAHRDAQISDLNRQVSELETQLAQAKAKPTQTDPKEDPSFRDPKGTTNKTAYDKDVANFKA